ncbi:RNase adapter RapZ [Nitrospira defluvii]|nr:RNase adapter RapZ [Nitrospira defluvii]
MSGKEKGVRLVIISGLSGSGKSCVIKVFEDLGFFCIDNLPPQLLPKFVGLCRQSRNEISRAAIGIDIRGRDFLKNFLKVYDRLIGEGCDVELLFLQARNKILQRRFSETRRPHPLAKEGTVVDGINRERKSLQDLRKRADRVIDTSDYHVHQLKEVITRNYFEKEGNPPLFLSLTSFGYKHGTPYDLDLLFDVRFLGNPFFIDELRPLTGNDSPVKRYIMDLPETKVFIDKLYNLLDFLLPLYEKEGKSYLTIGIGCTGGRHRSVTIVNLLKAYMGKKGIEVHCNHRDITVGNLT